ncbi:hypothetical protein BGZ97_000650 [Linnemannia gamsii]|uniref:Uncharacterized protein n=1 Tax=Linnemannia gamsii TaxID=64522 RepID=A0A9P6QXW1_9FUNG|nr:hypothetical protein BGZ97_000650 [Linnemannia gamsii]
MSDAAVAAVPICKGLENTEIPKGSSPSEKHKACWCGLTANKTWDDACVKSNTCPAELRDAFVQAIASSSSQPGFCDGVSATSDASASRFSGVSSSTKVAAVGAAALAVAGALL